MLLRLIYCFLFIWVGPAYPQSLSEVRPLSFGTLVIRDNSTVNSVTVPLTGSVGTTGDILVLAPGAPGRFTVSGLPGGAALDLMINAEPLFGSQSQSGETFFRINQFFIPSPITTDASGTATFDLGAQLDTSGNGNLYGEDSYSGSVTITVLLP